MAARSHLLHPGISYAWPLGLRAAVVEEGPSEENAPQLCGGGAAVQAGGAADAAAANRQAFSGLPGKALARATLAQPGHSRVWRAGG